MLRQKPKRGNILSSVRNPPGPRAVAVPPQCAGRRRGAREPRSLLVYVTRSLAITWEGNMRIPEPHSRTPRAHR